MSIPPIHFITVVWGTEYTRRFHEVVLPNHLLAGNLGCVVGHPSMEYWIYTTKQDELAIRSCASYRRLTDMVSVKFCAFPHAVSHFDNRHAAMT